MKQNQVNLRWVFNRTAVLFLVLSMAGLLTACEEKFETGLLEEMIIGNWSDVQYLDSVQTLKKTKSLPDDEYAIAFLENGQLKENKNSGWCGTPPISYFIFEGSWELQNDSTLIIESTYWGGNMTVTWRILDIDASQLSYYVINQYYEDLQGE